MDWELFLEKCKLHGVKVTENADESGCFVTLSGETSEEIDVDTAFELISLICEEKRTMTIKDALVILKHAESYIYGNYSIEDDVGAGMDDELQQAIAVAIKVMEKAE